MIRETYGTLAPVGALDDKALRRQRRAFIAVGYGIERDDKTKSTQAFLPPTAAGCWPRSRSTTVNRDYAYVLDEPRDAATAAPATATRAARTSTPPGEVVAITTTGDIPCKATDQATGSTPRVAHDFLDDRAIRTSHADAG